MARKQFYSRERYVLRELIRSREEGQMDEMVIKY